MRPFLQLRYTSSTSPDEQKIDRKLSKYSVTARMPNGQTTTRTVDGSQSSFLPTSSQIESARQLKSPTGISSPSVVGIMSGGANVNLSIGNDSQQSDVRFGVPSEGEEVNPDVIPNQYGTVELLGPVYLLHLPGTT